MKFEPHAYQAACIDSVVEKPSIGLFLDMGLGKTVITLTALKDLMYNRMEVAKCLIVAPKKVAEGTWQAEAAKWDHLKSLRLSTVLGSVAKRKAALYAKADIYIVNRENVCWLVDFYGKDWPFDMVVLDESSSFKNPQAKRFKALKKVRPYISRMVELSGTPSPNGLLDLWSQVYLLDGGERLYKFITHFRERYFSPGRRNRTVVFDYKPKPGAADAILEKISDICISLKSEDYLDLPDFIMAETPVILSPKGKKSYDELEKKMIMELPETEDDLITVTSAAALSGKLQQLANGAAYKDDGVTWVEIHKDKLDAFTELLEALNGEHALVYYSFKHDLVRLKEVLAKTKLRVAELKGQKEVDAWNNGEIDILLAHPASCAYGINLQFGGRHIIWFGLCWSLELYSQANKRLHRQGQKEKVIVHHLIAKGTRDEDLMKALDRKDQTQNYILESLKARIERVKETIR